MSFDYLTINQAKINHALITAINNFNLPNTSGTSGQILTNNGDSTTSWDTPSVIPISVGGMGEFNVSNGSGGWIDGGFSAPSSSGTNGQVLTNNGSNGTTWITPSGTLPSFTAMAVSPLAFGQDFTAPPSGATVNTCFYMVGFSPNYWQCAVPPPGGVPVNYAAVGLENYGRIKLSLPAGSYQFCGTFLSSNTTGIVTLVINGTTYTFDTGTAAAIGNYSTGMIIPFTVTGSGYQTVIINMSCTSTNGTTSTGYFILPWTDFFINSVF